MPDVKTMMQAGPLGLFFQSLTLSPAQVNTITAPEQTFTCPDAPAGWAYFVTEDGAPTANAPAVHARRSAANTIAITWVNPTAGNITPAAAATWRVFGVGPQAAQ